MGMSIGVTIAIFIVGFIMGFLICAYLWIKEISNELNKWEIELEKIKAKLEVKA